MKWITREKPKIDRIACPWLIKNFIDPKAEFIYVPYDDVQMKAKELDAIPFDIPGVEFSHYKDQCTFDYFVEKYKIRDPAVHKMAVIVRGADTDLHDLASQASGLWAISAGLAYNCKDDYELLGKGMVIYDALYSWAKHTYRMKYIFGTQNDHAMKKIILITIAYFCLFAVSHSQVEKKKNKANKIKAKKGTRIPAFQPLDTPVIERITGIKGKSNKGEYKITIPQNDLNVEVDGFTIIPPMGLSTWIAFTPSLEGAMVMGDIILTETDLKQVQQEVIKQGLTISAIQKENAMKMGM
jgi:hypothetical protein